MSRIVSVSTAIFDGYDLDDALKELAESGVEYVEPAFIKGYMGEFDETFFSSDEADKVRRKLDRFGLKCLAVSCHMDLGAPDATRLFARRMIFAKTIGAGIIISNSSKRTTRDRFILNIRELAQRADDLGLMIGLENPGHGADDLIPYGADGMHLLDEIGAASVWLNYDVGNIHSYNHGRIDIAVDIAKARPRIAHVHFKDIADAGSAWRFCGIGKGDINWQNVMATLSEYGPELPLALEIPLRLTRPGYADPVRRRQIVSRSTIRAELRDSLEFVRSFHPQS